MRHTIYGISLIVLLVCSSPTLALAHSGGTSVEGCHTNRKIGEYHCHGGKTDPKREGTLTPPQKNEAAYNAEFCARMGGKTGVHHSYTHATGTSYIRVDCETTDTVYEGGLDKRRSLDSLQQVLFAASLTGKKPTVVVYDTDGKIGRFEHRIRVACETVEVEFVHVSSQP